MLRSFTTQHETWEETAPGFFLVSYNTMEGGYAACEISDLEAYQLSGTGKVRYAPDGTPVEIVAERIA